MKNKSRFQGTFPTAVGLIAGLAIVSQCSGYSDDLWEKTVANVASSPVWLPGTVETVRTTLNGKGEKSGESFIRFEFSKDSNSDIPNGKLKALVENGKAVTGKPRDELEAEVMNEFRNLQMDMPFHIANPSDVITTRQNSTKLVNNIDCVGYAFESAEVDAGTGEEIRFGGTVWVDPICAVPLQIEAHMKGGPVMIAEGKIMSINLVRKYSHRDGVWMLASEKQGMWLNADFLFKKIVVFIETDSSFSDYWFWKAHI